MTRDETNSLNVEDTNGKGLLPSEFMRKLHPEYYSDSSGRTLYELDRATFEYHLESVTKRNETHDFEIFCRKLCERVICPNLRPATGPEGGGDLKERRGLDPCLNGRLKPAQLANPRFHLRVSEGLWVDVEGRG